MVLIISVSNDHSTSRVINWLRFLGKSFIRLNEDDQISIENLTYDNFTFKTSNGKKYSLKDFSSVWYRRGNFNLKNVSIRDGISSISDYETLEKEKITKYIHSILQKKQNSINNYNLYNVNKLEVLEYCKFFGLNSHEYLVTQSKSELQQFYIRNEKSIICKPMNTPFVYIDSGNLYSTYAYSVEYEDLLALPELFTPTFFQKNIEKKYEIRSFYLKGKFYSMAIFSQNNPKTQTDFRNYDWDKPNRKSPFQLPLSYEKKIRKLLDHFELDSASLDILVTEENEFNLIDVNPIGQFGMTSIPCNYNLEKIIAENLI